MAVQISMSPGNVIEGASGTHLLQFVVSLSAASVNNVTVDYQTISGTADEYIDYSPTIGTLTIAAGDTSGIVDVAVFGDTLDEPDESVLLQLTNPHNAVLANDAVQLRATGVILDDDGTGNNLALFVSSPTLVEGNSGSRLAEFEIRLSQPSATALSFAYTTADGTATAGQDYTAASGTVDFAPGQTVASVAVPVLGDGVVEPSENFSLVVTPTADIASGVDGATGVATILDDDAGGAAAPTVSVADAQVIEGASGTRLLQFVVSLSAASVSNVRVDYQTAGVTATEGTDFSHAVGTLTIAAGDTSGLIDVAVFGDAIDETDETLALELTNPVGAVLAGNAAVLRATGTILDDDGAGSNLALSVSSPIVPEGNTGSSFAEFQVTLSRPSSISLSVDFATSDGSAVAGQDYQSTSGTVIFAPGQTTAAVDVPVFGDLTPEGDETFSVTASALGLTDATGQATVVNDDGPICFLRGTLIETPDGDVPVEDLSIGDEVRTTRGMLRPIVWIGHGRVLATRGPRNAATPVIVHKGALADNVPRRDLRVTKGHALYIDDVLVPVEFLVNHRSIIWDDHAQEVEIYHIELETHDVLLANGAPAESYRDDGNRWLFRNANTGWDQPAKQPCAPVLTGGPVVDAAWRRLLERSWPRRGGPMTDDPDLHLLVDGQRIEAISRSDSAYVFRLARPPRAVRIRSRSAVPQELGIARDARQLGVAVRQIVLAQARRQWAVAAEASSLVDGYHAFEPASGMRWTDGDAAVPEELFVAVQGACMLMLHLGGATQYLDDGASVWAA